MKRSILSMLVVVLLLVGCKNAFDNHQESSDGITEEQALEIVFKELKFNEKDVERLRVKKDLDDRSYHYEIEFNHDGFNYDYEVDEFGEIIKSEKEQFANNSTTNNQEEITEEEALAIAFEHAGVKESDAERLRVEKDLEHNGFTYEIEFYINRLEYDYEIASNGEILKFESEQH